MSRSGSARLSNNQGAARFVWAAMFVSQFLTLASTEVAAQDRYFVTSHILHTVRSYEVGGGFLGDFVESRAGGISQPQQMVFGPGGDLYVSSFVTNAVVRFNGETGEPIGTVASGPNLNQPTHLSFDGGGNLIVSWWGSNRVVRHDIGSNTVLGDVITPGAALAPHGRLEYEIGGTPYLLVAAWNSNAVMRFFDNGTKESDLVTAGAGLNQPASLALDPDGTSFWVSNFGSGTVQRFDLATGAAVLPHISGLTNPDGLLLDDDGTLLVCDWGTNTVARYDTVSGNQLEIVSDLPGDGLRRPNGVIRVVDPNPVPAASTWGLCGLAILLLIGGTVQLRTRETHQVSSQM